MLRMGNFMQVLLQTNAADLQPVELMGHCASNPQAAVLLGVHRASDYKGGTYEVHSVYIGFLRNKTVGRKHSQYYEWFMGDAGCTFPPRVEAEAHAAKLIA